MLRFPLTFVLLGNMVQGKPPHLVLFVIDDLGYSDVGYHGSNFPTPNIDKLAVQGVRLERNYVQQVCSPTRAALMSGRYPFRTGMQHRGTLVPPSSAHLPLDATTLAEALGKVGYRCHAIGKWHLGYASWNYTPVGRGFESHAGFLQGQNDYYQHTNSFYGLADPLGISGFDFWRNKTAAKDQIGKHSMELYMEEAKRVLDNHNPNDPLFLYFAQQVPHVPLESPPDKIYNQNCANIKSPALDAIDPSWNATLPSAHSMVYLLEQFPGALRRIMCSMMSRLDKALGDFVDMLKGKGLWEDTVMWVLSDNGGATRWGPSITEASVSCNYPFRGNKGMLFEGGTRVVSFVTGGMSAITAAAGSVRWGLLQHVDISSTFAALGGAHLGADVDGFNVWNVIVDGHESPRTEAPLNIDPHPTQGNLSALIQGQWKLINTNTWRDPVQDGWWSCDPYQRTSPSSSQVPVNIDGWKVMLFDILEDPQERRNVALANPEIVRKMVHRIEELADPANGYRPPQSPPYDPRSNIRLHDGCLAPWLDKDDSTEISVVSADNVAVTTETLFM